MVAPDLPGVGGDAKALARASLRRWAEFIVTQARDLPAPVILCAHSRGGIVASQAAELAPDAFAAIVYITGALIPDGLSMYDVLGAEMESGAFGACLIPVADGLGLGISPEAAKGYFYNLCSADDRVAHAAQLVIEPVRPMGAKLSLSAERFGSVPRHYVECTADMTFPLATQQSMHRALPCKTVHRLESDHSPFIGMPDDLAAILASLAKEIPA